MRPARASRATAANRTLGLEVPGRVARLTTGSIRARPLLGGRHFAVPQGLQPVGAGTAGRTHGAAEWHHLRAMLDYLLLLSGLLRATLHNCSELVTENLLLRQQPAS